jgi:succinoglycan biosynthesis transport protein ExoP
MASFRPRSLGDFGAILWARKWLLFLATAAMLQASLLVIKKLPNQYESRAQLAILTKPTDETTSLAAQIAAMAQQAVSRQALEPLIKAYHLNRGDEDLEATAIRLRKEIKLEIKNRQIYPEFPETVLISYRHTDPQIAQKIAEAMVHNFTDTNEVMRQQATQESKDIERQLIELEEPLGRIASQRTAALRGAGREVPVEDPRVARRTLLSEVNSLNDKQFQLEKQIALQQQQISEQQVLAKTAVVPSNATANSSYGVLVTKKAELDALVKEYTKSYTNENPKLKQAQAQLQEINFQIEKMERSTPSNTTLATTPEGRELRGLERDLEKLKVELAVTQRNLESKRQELAGLPNRLPSTGLPNAPVPLDETAGAEYERLSKRYLRLLDKQEELQKAQTNFNVGPNLNLFRIIDKAFLPGKPAAPNRLLLKLIALGMSLGLGFLLVALVEARQFFRIRDERDVEYYLGAPVMGLIPETLTPVEHSLARRQKFARVALVVILAAAAVPVFALLLNQSGLFEVLGSK